MENDLKTCSCHQDGGDDIANYPPLKSLLPLDYNYVICFYENVDKTYINSRFHTNCFTKDEVLKWLSKFSVLTKLEFSAEDDCSASTQTIHVKCQCSMSKSCRTMLKFTINSRDSTTNEEDECLMHKHPTTVTFHYAHNISNDGSEYSEISEILIEEDLDDYIGLNDYTDNSHDYSCRASRSAKEDLFESATSDGENSTQDFNLEQFVRKKLYYLFDQDYSPQQAYNLYKKELHEIFEKEFTIQDTKNERPGMKWIHKHYCAYLEEKHGVKIETKDKHKVRTNGVKKVNIKEREITSHIEKTMKEISAPITYHQQNNPLGKKIDEQLKKYVPILPAFGPAKAEPEMSFLSVPSLVSNITDVRPVFSQSTPSTSYIIKFNCDQKNNKLNLFPLKLIPNTPIIQSSEASLPSVKLPELKIKQTSNSLDHILEVTAANNVASQNIPIPSGVDGIIILTSDQGTKPSLPDDSSHQPLVTESSTDSRKHRRKPCLKYEDADEVMFTDNIEDLKEKVEIPCKKSKRKLGKNSIHKKKKVILPCALDGIENVICHD